MGTLTIVLLGIGLALASPFILQVYRQRRDSLRAGARMRPGQPPRAEAIRPSNPFAAVSIRPSTKEPCAAVLQMHHRRFLAVRAPRLPVPGCDRGHCDCGYVRYADRRAPGDRRDGFAAYGGRIPGEGNRRETEDRRRDR